MKGAWGFAGTLQTFIWELTICLKNLQSGFTWKTPLPAWFVFLFFSWNFSLCNVCSTRVGYFLVSWVSLHACVEKPSPGMLSPNLPPWKLFCLPLKYLELPCLSWQSLAICDYLNISKIKRQLFHHTNYVSRAH